MSNIITTAKNIAIQAHKGQKRAMGEPYITHPKAVAEAMNCGLSKMVAWLHDVAEDTNTSLKDIRAILKSVKHEHMGMVTDSVMHALEAITHHKDENYLDYILRVKQVQIATKVKIADLEHNMSTCPLDNKWQYRWEKWNLAKYILES